MAEIVPMSSEKFKDVQKTKKTLTECADNENIFE